MGSVGDDYQCPHCDVVGKGGYPIDGIGYPICTGDAANCLDKVAWAWTRAMVKHEALLMWLRLLATKLRFSCDMEDLICLWAMPRAQPLAEAARSC